MFKPIDRLVPVDNNISFISVVYNSIVKPLHKQLRLRPLKTILKVQANNDKDEESFSHNWPELNAFFSTKSYTDFWADCFLLLTSRCLVTEMLTYRCCLNEFFVFTTFHVRSFNFLQ